LILNQVILNPSNDALLRAKHEEHWLFRRRVQDRFPDLELITIGLQPTEVRGREKLEQFSQFIFPASAP
jgi:anion-transporting  ArsA/GET3 family ATPase